MTTTARQILDRAMTERQWMDTVLAQAAVTGWEFYHPWNSMHSVKGWPDLVLCRPPRLIFAELKRESGGKVSAEQQGWLDLLRECGAETYVWKPSDWPTVEKVLARTGLGL